MASDARVFTTRFWPSFGWYLLWSSWVIVLALVRAGSQGFAPRALLDFVAVTIVLPVLVAMLTPLFKRSLQVTLSSEGIGPSHRLLSWSRIDRVEPRTYSGLRFLYLFTDTKTPAARLPLFLNDAAGFAAFVVAHAPPGNPIHKYFA